MKKNKKSDIRETDITIGDIKLFLKAVDLGGLALASAAFGIPRSSASRKLQRLEKTLGFPLLYRNAARFILTPEGEAFLPLARSAVRDLDEAVETIKEAKGNLHGVLKISVPYGYTRTNIEELLIGFTKLYPFISIRVEFGSRAVDLILNEADLAIRIGPPGSSDLISRRIGSESFILVASPSYIKDPKTHALNEISDLKYHRIIDFKINRPFNQFQFTNGKRWETLNVLSAFASNDHRVLISYVAAGLGVGLIPLDALCEEALASGRIERVLPEWRPPTMDVSILYAPGRGKSNRIRAFIDYATATLNDKAWTLSKENGATLQQQEIL